MDPGWTDGPTDGWRDGRTAEGWAVGAVHVWMDGTDVWMKGSDKWMDGSDK